MGRTGCAPERAVGHGSIASDGRATRPDADIIVSLSGPGPGRARTPGVAKIVEAEAVRHADPVRAVRRFRQKADRRHGLPFSPTNRSPSEPFSATSRDDDEGRFAEGPAGRRAACPHPTWCRRARDGRSSALVRPCARGPYRSRSQRPRSRPHRRADHVFRRSGACAAERSNPARLPGRTEERKNVSTGRGPVESSADQAAGKPHGGQ